MCFVFAISVLLVGLALALSWGGLFVFICVGCYYDAWHFRLQVFCYCGVWIFGVLRCGRWLVVVAIFVLQFRLFLRVDCFVLFM